jgi:hypothetical protein
MTRTTRTSNRTPFAHWPRKKNTHTHKCTENRKQKTTTTNYKLIQTLIGEKKHKRSTYFHKTTTTTTVAVRVLDHNERDEDSSCSV